MSEESHPRRSSPPQIAFLLFAGLVVYALSPGPVGWIMKTADLMAFAPYIRVVYYPLKYLYDNIPLVRAVYDAYFALFGVT